MTDIFLGNTFHGSWFLSALFLGVLIVYCAHKIARQYGVIVVLLCVYSIMYIPDFSYAPLDSFRSWLVSHGVILTLTFFRGCYWIGIGYFISHKRFITFIEKSNAKLFLMCAISLYIMIIMGINNLYPIFAISIYAFTYKLKLPDTAYWRKLRNLSILFYLLHFNICGFFHKLFPDVKWLYSGVLFYFIVVLVVFLLASMILYFEKYIKWLKYSH